MTCPSCGRIVQPGAAWCINVSCADFEKPFASPGTAPAATAIAVEAPPTARMRALRPVAALTTGAAGAVGIGAALGQDLVTFFALLLGAASFVVWLDRAYANLQALPGTHLPWSRGWAIGGWFVPLANLWLGPRVVVEVARASVPADDPITLDRLVKLARIWWAGSVVLWVPAQEWLVPVTPMNEATVSAFRFIALAGAACYIALVWWVTRLQETRFAQGVSALDGA